MSTQAKDIVESPVAPLATAATIAADDDASSTITAPLSQPDPEVIPVPQVAGAPASAAAAGSTDHGLPPADTSVGDDPESTQLQDDVPSGGSPTVAAAAVLSSLSGSTDPSTSGSTDHDTPVPPTRVVIAAAASSSDPNSGDSKRSNTSQEQDMLARTTASGGSVDQVHVVSSTPPGHTGVVDNNNDASSGSDNSDPDDIIMQNRRRMYRMTIAGLATGSTDLRDYAARDAILIAAAAKKKARARVRRVSSSLPSLASTDPARAVQSGSADRPAVANKPANHHQPTTIVPVPVISSTTVVQPPAPVTQFEWAPYVKFPKNIPNHLIRDLFNRLTAENKHSVTLETFVRLLPSGTITAMDVISFVNAYSVTCGVTWSLDQLILPNVELIQPGLKNGRSRAGGLTAMKKNKLNEAYMEHSHKHVIDADYKKVHPVDRNTWAKKGSASLDLKGIFLLLKRLLITRNTGSSSKKKNSKKNGDNSDDNDDHIKDSQSSSQGSVDRRNEHERKVADLQPGVLVFLWLIGELPKDSRLRKHGLCSCRRSTNGSVDPNDTSTDEETSSEEESDDDDNNDAPAKKAPIPTKSIIISDDDEDDNKVATGSTDLASSSISLSSSSSAPAAAVSLSGALASAGARLPSSEENEENSSITAGSSDRRRRGSGVATARQLKAAADKKAAEIKRINDCALKSKKKQDKKDTSVSGGMGIGGEKPGSTDRVNSSSSSSSSNKRRNTAITASASTSPAKKNTKKPKAAAAAAAGNGSKRGSTNRSTDLRSTSHIATRMDDTTDDDEAPLRAWFNEIMTIANNPIAASLSKVYSLQMIRDFAKDAGKAVLGQVIAAHARTSTPIMLPSMPAPSVIPSTPTTTMLSSLLVGSNDRSSSSSLRSLMDSPVASSAPLAAISSSSSSAAQTTSRSMMTPLGDD